MMMKVQEEKVEYALYWDVNCPHTSHQENPKSLQNFIRKLRMQKIRIRYLVMRTFEDKKVEYEKLLDEKVVDKKV